MHTLLQAHRAKALGWKSAGCRVLFAAVAISVLSSAAAQGSIFRHIGLASSTPAKDSHVTTALKEIRLTFTGKVDVSKASIALTHANGKAIKLDSLRAVTDSPRVAVAQVKARIAAGNYTVKWTAVAADGANGAGSFGFMYMPTER